MGKITDVPGVKVGHFTHREGLTGCTVLLFEGGARAGFDARGMASGSRQMDSLGLLHTVGEIHAVLLTGGSSFGLDATGGVMRYLEEKGIGYQTEAARIPIVPSMVIYDLGLGDPKARPDAAMAYEACRTASEEVQEGSVGVGTGATVGKLLGIPRAMKGGLGTSSVTGKDGLVVGALVVVNAFGDVFDPDTGLQLAGPLGDDAKPLRTRDLLLQGVIKDPFRPFPENTTLAVVATDARLDKAGATKLAQMLSLSLARFIVPLGTPFDGDIVLVASLGEKEADLTYLWALADRAVGEAIKRAILKAEGFGVLPAWRDLFGTL